MYTDRVALTTRLAGKLVRLSDRILRGPDKPDSTPDQTPPETPAPAPTVGFGSGYHALARPIEVDVSEDMLRSLFNRTRQQWEKLGQEEPHWSVITNDAFKRAELNAESELEFFDTGRGNADLLDIFEGRTRTHLSRGVCLELGCGVGRITRFLADRFERVIAVDISPGNLEICRSHLQSNGVTNVDLIQLQDITDLSSIPDFDVLFSVIVLQHNSPPLQQYILKTLLPKVRTGGGCLFQTCTNLTNYSFEAKAYINSPDVTMEVHNLPQYAVLRTIRESGLQIQEVAMDSWIDAYGSNTFFATR